MEALVAVVNNDFSLVGRFRVSVLSGLKFPLNGYWLHYIITKVQRPPDSSFLYSERHLLSDAMFFGVPTNDTMSTAAYWASMST